MAKGESYDEFVEKFKPKKTTDDCYTPPLVYEAVADYVAERYGVDRAGFVRPFCPGGDYERFAYPPGCTVVDNPPFSILTQIVRFYEGKGIRFFLFAPALTLFNSLRHFYSVTALSSCANIVYDNDAEVNTSFITNLEGAEVIARSAPELYEAVGAAVRAVANEGKAELPKYVYPDNLITAAALNKLARYGVPFAVPRSKAAFVSGLDEQKASGKTVFGGGLLVSDEVAAERAAAERAAAERAAAERAAAERAAATVWELSERERFIVDQLARGVSAGPKPPEPPMAQMELFPPETTAREWSEDDYDG